MRHLLLALVATVAISPVAHAKPGKTFSSPQSFKRCQDTWTFACGKTDSKGNTFGTAHKRTMCATYTFLANGEVELMDYPGLAERGRYHIAKGTVHIEVLDRKGKVTNRRQLRLTDGGRKLGEMTRIRR